MLDVDFEKAGRSDIEKVILEHGRLDISENTRSDFEKSQSSGSVVGSKIPTTPNTRQKSRPR